MRREASWRRLRDGLTVGLAAPRLRRDPLRHAIRSRIVQHVLEHPGVTVSGLQDALEAGWTTLFFHVKKLEAAEILVKRKVGRRRRIYVAGYDVEGQPAYPVLDEEPARTVARYVHQNPGVGLVELRRELGLTERSAYHALNRLYDAGLIESCGVTKYDRLRAAPSLRLAWSDGPPRSS